MFFCPRWHFAIDPGISLVSAFRLSQARAVLKRRDFIAILGGTAATWPLAARAQQAPIPAVGFLHSASARNYELQVNGFREGLANAGYVEGRNVAVEYRWAENQIDRLPALAGELVRRQVAVIAACGSPAAALAAKSATASIPIVFETGADPVQLGLVASLNHPGGNITGITNVSGELVAKRVGLLRELVPSAASIAALVNPTRPGVDTQSAQIQEAARAIGLPLHIVKAASEYDLDAAFSSLAQLKVGGLVMTADSLFTDRGHQIIALAKRYAVPMMYEFRHFVVAGGLFSYGPDPHDSYRQTGNLVGRILKGEKPADLPVMRPSKFELVINMKTAKALGIEVPNSMQLLADEVIE
jgi:putative ABC transport system substrate-binding protein